ncbi:transcription factor A, mitochondrial-like [Gigantopelta aegis]|uniref:transcription factor A, mitochondrial-like n=1 Tax=Gigantopelta aegis TaxID=1735272 RepID=UPI001B88B449|nr:transcription factor A, mitochondrial-like [Gigantopelta aegis]
MAGTMCASLLWRNCLQRFSCIPQRLPLEVRCMVSRSYPCQTVDPPRRPTPSFFLFFKSKQEEIAQNNPDLRIHEQAKIAGQLWRELDQKDKDRFHQEGLERFAEYKRQYENYLSNLTPNEIKEIKEKKRQRRISLAKKRKKRELKQLGKPLRSRNAFSLFLRSSKLERGDADVQTFLKGIVEYWKTMPENEKEIYYHDAALDKERYDKEMAAWEDKMKKLGREDLVRKASRTKSPRKKRTVVAKKKKPVSRLKEKVSKSGTKPKRKRKTVSKSTQTGDDD